MQKNYSCPITGELKDNNTIRITAGLVLTISAITITLGLLGSTKIAALILGLLGVDFITRAFLNPKYSPLAKLSKSIAGGLKLKKLMIDGGPKIFAARIGVIFTLGGTILYTLGLGSSATIVTAILLICAALEAFFNFCLGCWMYSLLPKSIGSLLTRQFLNNR